MITPNKVVPLSASVLGHLVQVLKAGPDSISVGQICVEINTASQ